MQSLKQRQEIHSFKPRLMLLTRLTSEAAPLSGLDKRKCDLMGEAQRDVKDAMDCSSETLRSLQVR